MWPWIDAMCLMNGVDIDELMEKLSAPRAIYFFMNLAVEDRMIEYAKERDEGRARILSSVTKDPSGYSSTESYGRPNDNFGHTGSEAPLPYIPPTPQTEDGYEGLAPPLG